MYRIHPFRCGTLTTPKDATTYLTDRDVELAFPVYAFLLEPTTDDAPTVLVDAGVKPSDSAYMRRNDREVGPPGGARGRSSTAWPSTAWLPRGSITSC
jgi:hypothetical protein